MKTRSKRSNILFRSVAALLLLSGVFAGTVGQASAQDEPGLVSHNEYESPQFDLTLSWDDPWVVSEGTVTSDEGSLDQISLENPDGFLQIILIVPNDEPQAYLDVLLENLQETGTDYEEIGTDSGTDYISATVDFTLDSQSGPLLVREYVEVATLETLDGDEALFTGSLLTVRDEFETQWNLVQESVERDGRDPVFFGVPEGITGGNSTSTGKSTNEGGIDGDTFVGPLSGFSVEWDGDLWDAEDSSSDDEDALVLNSDGSQVQLRSYNVPDGTNRTCVTDTADDTKAGDGVSGFGRNTDYPVPEPGDGAYARLYDFEYQSSSSDEPVVFLQYLECRPLGDEEGVFLLISLLSTEANYEDELALFEDVIATLEFGTGGGTDLTTGLGRQGGDEEETPTSGSTKEPVLKSASYTGGAYGYRVVWDKEVWEAEALTPDSGYEGVKLVSDGSSTWIEAMESYEGDPDTCVADTGEELEAFNGVSDVRKERRPALPETDPDASAAIYSYLYTSDDGDSLEFVEYIECRELVAGSVVLRVTIIAVFETYEDLIPEWEDLLAGVKIETTDDNSGGTEESSTGGTEETLPGVKGRKYTSPQFGFTLSWDSSWDAVSATDEEGGTTLTLNNGISTVIVFGGAFPLDPTECVETLAEVAATATGVSNFNIVTDNEGAAQAGGDENSGFGLYSFTRGGDDYFDYIYCQPATSGDYVVAVVYQMPVGELPTEFPVLEKLLGGLVVD